MKSIAIWFVVGTIDFCMLAIVAPAAEIALSAAITGTYSADGLTVNSSTGAVFDGQYHDYRVDIFALLTGTIGPTESFGATSFDVILGPGLSRVTTTNANIAANWRPNIGNFSGVEIASPPGVLSSYWTGGDNADLGTSSTDLIGIVQDIDASTLGKTLDLFTLEPIPDPRLSIARGSPFKLGSVYLQYNSGGPLATLSFSNAEFSILDLNNVTRFQPAVSTTIAPVVFGVPEPAANDLAFLATVALLLTRNRLGYPAAA